MRIDKIIEELAFNDSVIIQGGDVIITKILDSVIAGVSVYKLKISIKQKDGEIITSFDKLDQLKNFIEKTDLVDCCSECCGIPDFGYYIDTETGERYCCFECMVNALNKKYGVGNWKPAEEVLNDSEFTTNILIKVNENVEETTGVIFNVNGEIWKLHVIDFKINEKYEE